MPLDLFYWNGTCEELTSWNLVGGVQVGQSAGVLSTQGHTFRLRTADASRRLVFAHTLNDLSIRGCDEPASRGRPGGGGAAGMAALLAETDHFESETARLRELLAQQIARLRLSIAFGGGNASAIPAASEPLGGARVGAAVAATARVSALGIPLAS